MESLQSFLLVIQIISAILLVILVLLQPGSEGGFVSSMGAGNPVFSAQSAANFLSKTTAIVAIIFMINTIGLGILANKQSKKDALLLDSYIKKQEKNIPNNNTIPLAE